MANRNLARTVVEGGRKPFCRHEEHVETVTDRRRAKRLCHVACREPEWMEDVCFWRDKPFDKEFRDHLRPLRQFLMSRVGKSWTSVYSELCCRYDRRSMKGWHLLDHVRGYVDMDFQGRIDRGFWQPIYDLPYNNENRKIIDYKWYRYSYQRYYFEIDNQGILRKANREVA